MTSPISELRRQAELGEQVEKSVDRVRDKAQGDDQPSEYGGAIILAIVTLFVLVTGWAFLAHAAARQKIEEPISEDLVSTAYAEEVVEETPEEEATQPDPEPPPPSPSYWGNFPEAVAALNACKQNEHIIRADLYARWSEWYGEEEAIRMCVILKAENGTHDPMRVGQNQDRHRSKDVGIFQINTYWHCDKAGFKRHLKDGTQSYMGELNDCISALQDVETNIAIARRIYEGSGWGAWYGRNEYLPEFWADRLTMN